VIGKLRARLGETLGSLGLDRLEVLGATLERRAERL